MDVDKATIESEDSPVVVFRNQGSPDDSGAAGDVGENQLTEAPSEKPSEATVLKTDRTGSHKSGGSGRYSHAAANSPDKAPSKQGSDHTQGVGAGDRNY
jgi:hypothetical protein